MNNQTAPVAAVAAMFCTTVVGVCLVAVLVPGQDAVTLIGLILAALASSVPSVLALAKIGSVERTVDDLSNGRMDAKIRAGVADVLPRHMIDPAVATQLEADRARRDTHH